MSEKEALSNVYILVYPELKGFKIGKADDVSNRISALSSWGTVDYKNSYVVTVSHKIVFKI
jgi:hypothetical protein